MAYPYMSKEAGKTKSRELLSLYAGQKLFLVLGAAYWTVQTNLL